MAILDVRDWKYRISLCDNTLGKVNSFVQTLDSKEAEIYRKIIDSHLENYSLDMVLTLIEEGGDAAKILSKAIININKAIKVPPLLEEYYRGKISRLFGVDLRTRNALTKLLDVLISDERTLISTDELQGVIFGRHYESIKESLPNRGYILEKSRSSVEKSSVKRYATELLNKAKNDSKLNLNYGEYKLSDYDLTIINGVGFGEWRDKGLDGEDKDTLVLKINRDSLNKDDFGRTLYHEVYPGHGHFYDFASKVPNFDHGAVSLIEGWATYCEWYANQTEYSNGLRERGKEYLETSLSKPELTSNAKIEAIYENMRIDGYSGKESISKVLYFSQYPGYQESYYLGALCIEKILGKHKPVEFLKRVEDKTCGELYALWD